MISIILVIEFLYAIITIAVIVCIMLGFGWVVNKIDDFFYMRKEKNKDIVK